MKKLIPVLMAGIICLATACTPAVDTLKRVAWVENAANPADFDITYQDFMSEYVFSLASAGYDEENPDDAENCYALREQIIEFLIQERIHLAVAEELGVGASSLTAEEVQTISDNADYLLNGLLETFIPDAESELGAVYGESGLDDKISARARELYLEYLAYAGISEEIVLMWQRNTFIETKLMEYVLEDIRVDESEVEAYMQTLVDEAKNTYEQSPEDYGDYSAYYFSLYVPNGTREIRRIFVEFSEVRSGQIAALRAEGDHEGAERLREEASAEISEAAALVHEELRAGGDFEALSAAHDGDADSFILVPGNTEYGAEFLTAAMSLTAPGDISEPVLTDGGYYIIEYIAEKTLSEEEYHEIVHEVEDSMLAEAQYIAGLELQEEWASRYAYTIDYEAIGLDSPDLVSEE